VKEVNTGNTTVFKIAKNTSEETVHYNRMWMSTPFREKIKILQLNYNIWKHCLNLHQN